MRAFRRSSERMTGEVHTARDVVLQALGEVLKGRMEASWPGVQAESGITPRCKRGHLASHMGAADFPDLPRPLN